MFQRAPLGDELPIMFQVVDSSGNPAEPDAAPTLKVYATDDTKVYDKSFPYKDSVSVTGLVGHFVRLGSEFAVGLYSWRANWEVSATPGVASGYFEVIGGGHEDGAVIAMHAFETPQGMSIVYESDGQSGVQYGRDPRL